MKKKLLPALLVLVFATVVHAQDRPLWLRYPAISPDGSTILFSYKGDIYRVSSKGGDAVPLTISEFRCFCDAGFGGRGQEAYLFFGG
jgi:hypothetical protein